MTATSSDNVIVVPLHVQTYIHRYIYKKQMYAFPATHQGLHLHYEAHNTIHVHYCAIATIPEGSVPMHIDS